MMHSERDVKVICEVLIHNDLKVNALFFLPTDAIENVVSIMTHGYTSHKASLLAWAQRMAGMGIPCVLFDLPGHFLGSFHPLESFDDFKDEAHYLFLAGVLRLKEHLKPEGSVDLKDLQLIFAGHSLGALLAVKALSLPALNGNRALGLLVGFAMNRSSDKAIHALEMPFFQKTFLFRQQLVSPELNSQNVFPWIKLEKERLHLLNLGDRTSLHLLTGDDDLIALPSEAEALRKQMQEAGHSIELHVFRRLPHHDPEMATPHLFQMVKAWISA